MALFSNISATRTFSAKISHLAIFNSLAYIKCYINVFYQNMQTIESIWPFTCMSLTPSNSVDKVCRVLPNSVGLRGTELAVHDTMADNRYREAKM